MNNDFVMYPDIKVGVNKIKIKNDLFRFIKGFEIIRLKNKSKISINTGKHEVGLVVLRGKCDIRINNKTYGNLGTRDDVFSGGATAVYVPIDNQVDIFSYDVEVAACYAECGQRKDVAVITPEKIRVMRVGKDNWERQVSLIISPDVCSVNLIIGETINPPGNWSGTPAHKHEADNSPNESLHEELYFFKCDKKQGFGIERFYSPERNINELIFLKENSVTFMPWGYHQVVAGPGYTLYYLFFLSGLGGKLIGLPDPEHKWLNE